MNGDQQDQLSVGCSVAAAMWRDCGLHLAGYRLTGVHCGVPWAPLSV